ncbi:T9SS type A sorting domain-containing protein [Aquimarina sp. 2201CG5-10]|uniref:T9SS type A sorting domain-containing protein n=1 Tax=Aquimarina callyspongiae TaxID=3098150 RepID=UPI002AB3E150|nr:T9SS type A sorting domain-containing protein [Aquimarina sp. 2201CG5-10]MDY8137026.1 T9SS type A sorting domain-containing protein [Aquimarina sp. 2201CG5-10]
MKKTYLIVICVAFVVMQWSCKTEEDKTIEFPLTQNLQKEKKEDNPDKNAIWTAEQAARHQKILSKLSNVSKSFQKSNFNNTYANGELVGTWTNRGPKNMPGAFKFAEMLDGTDIIYGVTHNHYVGEYNSKSYIFRGTIYNPNTGTGGDDFVLLTANWPNRYQNLFAFKVNGTTRLIAHVENGPLYYSDDEGNSWTRSNGLPSSNTSSAINRQDNHTIYVTNNSAVYVSTDFGINFSLLKDFGASASSFVYTPRYNNQPQSNQVYLARSGSFYVLNSAKTDFDFRGSYTSNHGSRAYSIGGDSRKLYVTEDKNYWVSSDGGTNWVEKFPKGNWYGDRTGKMSSGMFLAVHPENTDIMVAGYAQPVISLDGLDNTLSDATGWGRYQNGTNLSAQDYYNRIRFNYHPDFQSSHFFYNSNGDLFSARCSDGGIFISYKEWSDFPAAGVGYDNSGYANAHFINLNVLNTINPLIYRENVFTGINNPNHINYSTQDQGSESIIPGTSGDVLDFYQSIGGDGPPLDSYDGENVWKWARQGDKVYAPVKMYTNSGGFRSVGQMNGQFNSSPTVDFTRNTDMGWVQTYIDHNEPDKRIWVLAKNLDRATWNGATMQGHTINKGTNQVAAIAQAWTNPDKIFMLQDGKIFISNDRGTNFGSAINTPFTKTPGGWGRGDIGSGVVLPNNDNWILFCGPSNNNVGSILSKDGGNSWVDVTGDFPADNDAQTGGMIVTPDNKFVFAGTDIGPYVFDVSQEKWYSIAEGIGFFNAMDVDYISSTNTVRFGSWGSGILDFKIEETLGVNDNLITENFSIYPNPAKEFVTVTSSLNNLSDLVVGIFTIKGEKVYSKHHAMNPDKSLRLDVTNLSAGLYMIQFRNKKQTITKKIVIR